MISKDKLLSSLPLCESSLTLRPSCREDIDRCADWPPYPPPYSYFNSDLAFLSESARNASFAERNQDPTRVSITVDHDTQPVIGFVVLHDIDWSMGAIGNMGLRIHPLWCDKGIGTAVMNIIAINLTRIGAVRFRFDVQEENSRAIRCYEKVGFTRMERFDRYGIPFLWMELNKT